MGEVTFVDTTLRDGQSSLWGYRMMTEMLFPIVARMDRAGFSAMEAHSYNTIKMRVLRQKEHPWGRIRLLAKDISKTPLMIITSPAFDGIKRVQIIGFMNDLYPSFPNQFADEAMLRLGKYMQ